MHEIAASCGIEIEVSTVAIEGRQWPPKKHGKIPKGWSLVRDGSCTRRRPVIHGVGVEATGPLRDLLPTSQTGGELVSGVFHLGEDRDRIRTEVQQIMDLLQKSGESVSNLTSTHFHIFVGNLPPLKVLRNVLEITRRIEAPMYRLGVAELLEHRGIVHNDYMYCRPIMGDGPQYIRDGNGLWRQCFDLDRILQHARSSKEVIQAWGRSDILASKWIPPRYYWLNPVSIVRQGTLEFRLFNQTMDTDNVMAWLDLCAAIVRSAYGGVVELDQPMFSLGDSKVAQDYHLEHMFQGVVDPTLIPEDSMRQLYRMWVKTKWQRGVLGPQVNHMSKDGRETYMYELRKELIPPPVERSYVDSIWNDGYYDH